MTASGRTRALGLEVSEHARAVRAAVEAAARPYLTELVADTLHDHIRVLRVDPASLPPHFVGQVALAIAQRFSLEQSEDARRAVLDGLWAAINALLRHRPSAPALPAVAPPPTDPDRKDPPR